MGAALAAAARDAGWAATLLLGPAALDPPEGVAVERFESAADLEALLADHFPRCDLLVMAAAVADYRAKTPGGEKLQRRGEGITLELESTPDLVAACAARKRPDQRIVGFALEERAKLDERARSKLARKRLDAIVANPLETMGADRIDAALIAASGNVDAPGPMPKSDFARWLIERLADDPL